MNASLWALFVFVTQMAGWFAGRIIRSRLPPEHLTSSTRDAVVLAAGTVATLAALVLGLMISSAKASFDADRASVVEIATNTLLMDRALAHYGDDSKVARETLRNLLQRAVDSISASELERKAAGSGSPLPLTDRLQTSLLKLVPSNDGQRWVQTRALALSAELERARVLFAERADSSIPVAFLIVLTAWLAMLYLAFAIFAPTNATVTATAWGGALALSAAIFLIIELDTPFHGMISLSGEPLVNTLRLLGR